MRATLLGCWTKESWVTAPVMASVAVPCAVALTVPVQEPFVELYAVAITASDEVPPGVVVDVGTLEGDGPVLFPPKSEIVTHVGAVRLAPAGSPSMLVIV